MFNPRPGQGSNQGPQDCEKEVNPSAICISYKYDVIQLTLEDVPLIKLQVLQDYKNRGGGRWGDPYKRAKKRLRINLLRQFSTKKKSFLREDWLLE